MLSFNISDLHRLQLVFLPKNETVSECTAQLSSVLDKSPLCLLLMSHAVAGLLRAYRSIDLPLYALPGLTVMVYE
jgi:hypothetical protein